MLLQIALAAVLGVSAHADNFGDCVRNNANETICKNQRVITTSNQLGTVNDVFSNGKAIVQRDGYSSPDQFTVDALSAETRCIGRTGICKGGRAITSSNQTGGVVLAFRNGKVQLQRDGYSSPDVFASDALAAEVDSVEGFYPTARVITSSNQTGAIVTVYSNGKAKVQRDGYSSPDIFQTNALGLGVQYLGELTVGSRVITTSNQLGTVVELFNNAKAKVQRDGYSSPDIFATSALAAQAGPRRNPGPGRGDDRGRVPPPGRNDPRGPGRNPPPSRMEDSIIRKDDRVVTSSNQTGTVIAAFSNGKVQVQRDGYSSPDTFEAASLGKGLRFFQGFQPGDRVITRSNQTGKLVEVFSNGKAKVQRDGYSSPDMFSLSDLSN